MLIFGEDGALLPFDDEGLSAKTVCSMLSILEFEALLTVSDMVPGLAENRGSEGWTSLPRWNIPRLSCQLLVGGLDILAVLKSCLCPQ